MAFNAIRPGAIEKVKKIEDRDYAFVHFLRREDALFAIQVHKINKLSVICGKIEVCPKLLHGISSFYCVENLVTVIRITHQPKLSEKNCQMYTLLFL